jgi:acetoin utilization deacetylase AcuC-like enzyme
MITFTSQDHAQYTPTHEYFRGELVPAFEKQARLLEVLKTQRVQATFREGAVLPCPSILLQQVHTPRYLAFLATAWQQLEAQRGHVIEGSVFPSVWPTQRASMPFRSDVEPRNFIALLGLYSFDNGTPLTRGSWAAAKAGADAAFSAASCVASHAAPYAFVATRPPGHHAGADFMGGYCFLNNAAVAAQTLLNQGSQRVAVLDVDYHHGNGTQDIFYARSDVFVANIHADPLTDYPFFIGHADERGVGAGAGFNLNLPLPQHTSASAWFAALDQAQAAIQAAQCDALVVSLGVDTFADDPICSFKLVLADYLRLGQKLASLGLPTVLVLEGGYAVDAIGANVGAVLAGFEAGFKP